MMPTDQKKVGMRMMAPEVMVKTAITAAAMAPNVTYGTDPS